MMFLDQIAFTNVFRISRDFTIVNKDSFISLNHIASQIIVFYCGPIVNHFIKNFVFFVS